MKRISNLTVLAGGVVMAAFLAFFEPLRIVGAMPRKLCTTTKTVDTTTHTATVSTVGMAVATPHRPRATTGMFSSHRGTMGSRTYGYSLNRTIPFSYNNRFDYGIGPSVHVYGRSGFYRPSYGPVYVPFGYSEY